jgi:RhoGEF domain/Ankyrin repeat
MVSCTLLKKLVPCKSCDIGNFKEARTLIAFLIANASISSTNKWVIIARLCLLYQGEQLDFEIAQAIQEHEDEVCKLLIHFHCGSMVNFQDSHGNTLLHLAVEQEQPSICFAILCKAASLQGELVRLLKQSNIYGETPLHIACKLLNSKLVHLLVLAQRSKRNELVAIRDNNQRTPLMQTLNSLEQIAEVKVNNFKPIISLLIASNPEAVVKQYDASIKSVFQYAQTHVHKQLLKPLIARDLGRKIIATAVKGINIQMIEPLPLQPIQFPKKKQPVHSRHEEQVDELTHRTLQQWLNPVSSFQLEVHESNDSVIKELVVTECHLYHYLNNLKVYFMDPLSLEYSCEHLSRIISLKKFYRLFAHAQVISIANDFMAHNMQQIYASNLPVELKVLQLLSFIEEYNWMYALYRRYISAQEHVPLLLSKLSQVNEQFNTISQFAAMAIAEQDPIHTTNELASLLQAPVQRVPQILVLLTTFKKQLEKQFIMHGDSFSVHLLRKTNNAIQTSKKYLKQDC